MTPHPSSPLVIGVSASALFDLRDEEARPPEAGPDLEADGELLAPGRGLGLVRALAQGRGLPAGVELVVLSQRDADASVRLLASIRSQGIDIPRAAFTGGEALAPYLRAFRVDLFLGRDESEVAEVSHAVVAARVLDLPGRVGRPPEQIRVALDIDALGGGEADEPASAEERSPAGLSLEGLARTLARLRGLGEGQALPVRIALVTSHASADQERVLRGLRRAGLRVDEAFSLGGLPKDEVLAAFAPQILVDGRHLPVSSETKPEPPAAATPEEPAAPPDEERTGSGLHSPFSRLRLRSRD
jgi:5'-nucleotidase